MANETPKPSEQPKPITPGHMKLFDLCVPGRKPHIKYPPGTNEGDMNELSRTMHNAGLEGANAKLRAEVENKDARIDWLQRALNTAADTLARALEKIERLERIEALAPELARGCIKRSEIGLVSTFRCLACGEVEVSDALSRPFLQRAGTKAIVHDEHCPVRLINEALAEKPPPEASP
jgi:hypothetical protein